MAPPKEIKQISEAVWELPTTFKKGMNVPARIYATKKLLNDMDAGVFEQVTNVACLPGIQSYSYCMPDGHWGYGFPIGGVAAFDPKEGGVISPGGIGFDINCGMRLITTNLTIDEVKPKIKQLVDALYKKVPAGVGCKVFVKISKEEFKEVMRTGAEWCIKNGYGWKKDLENIESGGRIPQADPSVVSDRAIKRGFDHQIGTDYLRVFLDVMPKYGIEILDRELACAPFNSPEGQEYYKAMACAANMAFANRQVITHQIRKVFSHVFGKSAKEMEMNLVYDVAHNIAKLEKYVIDGKEKKLLVHRKGSTRAFGPQRAKDLPKEYRKVGQPVI